MQAVDENDSGNDEPSEGQLSNDRCVRVSAHQSRSTAFINIQRSLYQRVKELSVRCAVDEQIYDGGNYSSDSVDHMAKLPPEGETSCHIFEI